MMQSTPTLLRLRFRCPRLTSLTRVAGGDVHVLPSECQVDRLRREVVYLFISLFVPVLSTDVRFLYMLQLWRAQ
jgi:hypothetical protein